MTANTIRLKILQTTNPYLFDLRVRISGSIDLQLTRTNCLFGREIYINRAVNGHKFRMRVMISVNGSEYKYRVYIKEKDRVVFDNIYNSPNREIELRYMSDINFKTKRRKVTYELQEASA